MSLPKRYQRFSKYAWFVLGYTVLVILWGALVRATGSGAGCGEHWPLCNGTVIPQDPEVKTLIEFSHRLTSGLCLVFAAVLLVWARRLFPKGHAARHGAHLSMIFLLIEAGIGAVLVLMAWVGDDDSVHRAIAVAVHLVNTFLLLGVQTYTAWAATVDARQRLPLSPRGPASGLLWAGGIAFMAVGASGAIVALGDTLFPATSLVQGIREDFSATAHFLIRLRIIHPILAVGTAALLLYGAGFVRARVLDRRLLTASRWLSALLVVQVVCGFVNMGLLAPVWLQMTHLLLADAAWVALMVAFLVAAEHEAAAKRPARSERTASITTRAGDLRA